ncbi:hypothetical protein SKAU_G00209300 [Synaphobranchus kaupii]|uniref:Uncharacterized protein n=1 Tax=Synaphobranchus kaupii TaxID=118154 RepID=A0A9Q1F8K6_SYNKA|nr:hypothetical protein SKAU_G00209300 [Synaphobranchus kaupii]
MDYLDFICTQEMIFISALSRQIEMPQEVMDVLTELSNLMGMHRQDHQQPPTVVQVTDLLCALSEVSGPHRHKPQAYPPLNLTCLRKEQLQGGSTIYVTPQTASPVNIVATQQPTLVAITSQGTTVPCLRAISTTTKRTILILQLT